jgi:hypothetical protein
MFIALKLRSFVQILFDNYHIVNQKSHQLSQADGFYLFF